MNCCNQKPIIELSAGEKLCKSHFTEYFESKVFKTIRQFDLIEKEEHLGIALSGGKDSLTLLHLLNKLSKQNPKIRLTAIAINEGIHDYRDKTLITAKEFCEKNNIPLHIYSFEDEFGMSLDDALKILDVKPCTICGIFRRYLLNKKSKELGFTKLATGHNLDDEAQSILMNQFKNNIQASARLGPKVGIKHAQAASGTGSIGNKNFVQRIKPLYLCTEKEVTVYAYINGLLDNFNECPNVSKSYRAQIRDMLNNFENDNPGTKYAIINSFLQALPDLKGRFKDGEINSCSNCGEPSSKDKCNACKFADKLEKAKVTVKS
ncbi:TIGR00269 family protein [Candidatus Woesearchaeota archaeon]|nr:TIGR00269 family protein [Candidatus Woesearchaeota archaeon]